MQNLAQALASFHAEVGPIFKQSDSHHGKYADLATVLATVTPTLSKHGLVVTQTFSPFEEGTTLLRTTLLHASGESITSDLPIPSVDGARNQQNALQALGGAITYLRRYSLQAILNLQAEDDDGNSFASEPKAVSKVGTGTQRQPAKRTAAPAAPAPAASASSPALSEQEKKLLTDRIKALGPAGITEFSNAFRKHYQLAPDVPVSNYLNTRAESEFVERWFASHNGTAAAVAS